MTERRALLALGLGLLLILFGPAGRADDAAPAICGDGERLEARGLFADAARSYEACLEEDPARPDLWLAWAEALLRGRGRPVYEEVHLRLGRFVEAARQDPGTDPAELQEIEELILDLEDLLTEESPEERSGPWTLEEIVEVLSREGIRGRSRYDGPRVPLQLDFRPGDASLGAIARQQLQTVARALRDGVLATITIEIEGHTDNQEARTPDAREALARRRAEVVRDFLVREHGIPRDRLSIKARADQEPFRSNGTPEGRAANRRVELVNTESNKPLLKDVRTPD